MIHMSNIFTIDYKSCIAGNTVTKLHLFSAALSINSWLCDFCSCRAIGAAFFIKFFGAFICVCRSLETIHISAIFLRFTEAHETFEPTQISSHGKNSDQALSCSLSGAFGAISARICDSPAKSAASKVSHESSVFAALAIAPLHARGVATRGIRGLLVELSVGASSTRCARTCGFSSGVGPELSDAWAPPIARYAYMTVVHGFVRSVGSLSPSPCLSLDNFMSVVHVENSDEDLDSLPGNYVMSKGRKGKTSKNHRSGVWF